MKHPQNTGNVRRAIQSGSISIAFSRDAVAVIGAKRQLIFQGHGAAVVVLTDRHSAHLERGAVLAASCPASADRLLRIPRASQGRKCCERADHRRCDERDV